MRVAALLLRSSEERKEGLTKKKLSQPRYLKVKLLREGIRHNARRISRRWAAPYCTAHCQDNSLAEADDALSQQRTSK